MRLRSSFVHDEHAHDHNADDDDAYGYRYHACNCRLAYKAGPARALPYHCASSDIHQTLGLRLPLEGPQINIDGDLRPLFEPPGEDGFLPLFEPPGEDEPLNDLDGNDDLPLPFFCAGCVALDTGCENGELGTRSTTYRFPQLRFRFF